MIILVVDDVLEEELVVDVILVAQGLEGRLAKYDPKAEAYRFPENVSFFLIYAQIYLKSCYRLTVQLYIDIIVTVLTYEKFEIRGKFRTTFLHRDTRQISDISIQDCSHYSF